MRRFPSRGASTVPSVLFGNSVGSSDDFGYDTELLTRDQVDEKALLNLRGVIRTSFTSLNGHSYQNLDAFAPAAEWEALSCTSSNQEVRECSQDEL